MRLKAIQEVRAAGINTRITMTPLLPVENPDQFVQNLLETGVSKFVVQPFHPNKSKFVAGTGDDALKIANAMGWSMEKYYDTVKVLKKHLPFISEGKAGFAPI